MAVDSAFCKTAILLIESKIRTDDMTLFQQDTFETLGIKSTKMASHCRSRSKQWSILTKLRSTFALFHNSAGIFIPLTSVGGEPIHLRTDVRFLKLRKLRLLRIGIVSRREIFQVSIFCITRKWYKVRIDMRCNILYMVDVNVRKSVL